MIPDTAFPQEPYIASDESLGKAVADDGWNGYGEAAEPSAEQALFYQAASAGDVGELARLLPLCDPLLPCAARNGANHPGLTALMLAAAGGHAEAVRFLLPASDPLAVHKTKGGGGCHGDALMIAAGLGHVECVQVLEPVSSADTRHGHLLKATALMVAAMGGTPNHKACFEALLNRWDINAKDEEGNTAAARAARTGDLWGLALTAPLCDLGSRNARGETALHLAVRSSCSLDAVKTLLPLMSPAQVQLKTHIPDRSALMTATIAGEPEVARLLLPKSDLRADCSKGRTALDWAFHGAQQGGSKDSWRVLDAYCDECEDEDVQEALDLCPAERRQEMLPRLSARNEARALADEMRSAVPADEAPRPPSRLSRPRAL